jgi:hypothetical protein
MIALLVLLVVLPVIWFLPPTVLPVLVLGASIVFSLVRERDGRESRPVSLESPSASRAPASVERAKR